MTEIFLSQIQAFGKEVGFDALGVTTADPFPELVPALTAYESRGRTGFESANIEARIDPKAWLPEAKSVIAVAMAYLTPDGEQMAKRHPRQELVGMVSVYSYGQDYHRVMEQRLKQLQERIERHLGRPILARTAVDTSPLVDRRVAERAGIGWLGKNCLLYTPEHGSFVFLGALLTDVDIEVATEEQNSRCGTCTRCLQACPTAALVAPGVIEATRCLSYITQMKGVIPLEYRALLGRRVWGCDTCQWACPENRDVQAAGHAEYLPLGELAYPDLVAVLGLSAREFQRQYGATAAAWRGVRIWQRNALLALGNLRNPAAVAYIVPFLQHARQELRISAAWALMRIGGEEARIAVLTALAGESDPLVASEMQWAKTAT